MKIKRIAIPQEKLRAMPKPQQKLFIRTIQLFDELLIIEKLLHFVNNKKHDNRLLSRAQSSSLFFLIRMEIGLLWEGWNLLRNDYLKPGCSGEYDGELSESGRDALKDLQAYFSKKNPVERIRNEFSFHYSTQAAKEITEEIANPQDTADFEMFLGDTYGNCLWPICDYLVMSALIRRLENANPDYKTAMGDLAEEVNRVRGNFMVFLPDLLQAILVRYIGYEPTEVAIPDPPKGSDVYIPYFTKPSVPQ